MNLCDCMNCEQTFVESAMKDGICPDCTPMTPSEIEELLTYGEITGNKKDSFL